MNQVDVKVITTREHYLKGSFRSTFKRKNNLVMEQ